MAPRRKATQKPAKPSVDDMPPVIIEDMSHITVRRPVTKDNVVEDNLIQEDEKDVILPVSENNTNMNVTVVLEEIPDFKHKVTELESESDLVVDEAESIKKPVQKKVTKTKSKSKKQVVEDTKAVKTRKRAASEDRQVLKIEEKVVSKSRKRPVDKNLPESLKPVSPLNELPKRNRRAASVDILTSETSSYPSDKIPKKKVNSKSTKTAIVVTDDAQKKQKKGTKKEEQPKVIETKDNETKIVEKNSKGKKNIKKVSNEEKENVTTEQNDVEVALNSIQERPKSKRGIKKVIIDDPVEDEDEDNKEEEKVTKPSSRSRAASKTMVKQNSEKDLEKKQKSVPKTKKNMKSSEVSEESSEINETDDSNKSPEIKPKRERKFKQIDVDLKDNDFKEIKAPKRGGRKAKVEDDDVEEVQQKSPTAEHENNQESGDMVDDLPDSPDSGKKEVVKPIAAKRKTKAKSKK